MTDDKPSEQPSRPNGPLTDANPPDYALLARMLLRERKPFGQCALAAGYSLSVARRGLKGLMEDSKPLAEAIRVESESILKETSRTINLPGLKPLAVARLHSEITNPKSNLAMKAIELAGRFKETDWFVRNSPDVQIGIINTISELADTTLADYKDTDSSE